MTNDACGRFIVKLHAFSFHTQGMLWAYALLAGISPPERVLSFITLEDNVTMATMTAVTGNVCTN